MFSYTDPLTYIRVPWWHDSGVQRNEATPLQEFPTSRWCHMVHPFTNLFNRIDSIIINIHNTPTYPQLCTRFPWNKHEAPTTRTSLTCPEQPALWWMWVNLSTNKLFNWGTYLLCSNNILAELWDTDSHECLPCSTFSRARADLCIRGVSKQGTNKSSLYIWSSMLKMVAS